MIASRLGSTLAAALAAAAVLAVSGCGASNAIDPVARAADLSAGSAGYSMTFAMQVSAPVLGGSLTATGTGSFSTAAHSGSFDLVMKLPGGLPGAQRALELQEVLKGPIVYVKVPAVLAARVPWAAARPWLRVDMNKALGTTPLGALSANPFSGDPSQLLQYLRGAGAMTKVASAWVAGRTTTHYTGHVDLDQVAGRLRGAQRGAMQNAISALEAQGVASRVPVDVWVDGGGLVRQIQLHLTARPAGEAVSTTIRVVIPRYGPQPAPAIPPASQVTDAGSLSR